jgi:hypothetical protein
MKFETLLCAVLNDAQRVNRPTNQICLGPACLWKRRQSSIYKNAGDLLKQLGHFVKPFQVALADGDSSTSHSSQEGAVFPTS